MKPKIQTRGPFHADQLRSGDPYELSNGHAIHCLPTGGRGSRANLIGAEVLASDPDAKSAGVDTGFSPEPGVLRAPDVAIGNVTDEPGWVTGVPLLAVEYADRGQDEDDLAQKIQDLLSAGTLFIWVVRLNGARRVEIYEAGKPMRTALPGEDLLASGVLRNPVPVLSLYERDVANAATLRNLLQRQGYDSVEAVRAEGERAGEQRGQVMSLQTAILDILALRGLPVNDTVQNAIHACNNLEQLNAWLRQAAVATSLVELENLINRGG